MPGSGPPPAERRRRANKDTYADIQATVKASETLRGPDLDGTHLPQTLAWYETWRRSPQSEVFQTTDWQRLAMLAPIVDAYFADPDTRLMTEIRLNESLLGATHVDRLKARIKVEPKPPTGAPPDEVDARRKRRERLAG